MYKYIEFVSQFVPSPVWEVEKFQIQKSVDSQDGDIFTRFDGNINNQSLPLTVSEATNRKRELNFYRRSGTGDGRRYKNEKYRRFYCRFCSACGLGQWWFVICLGFLGAVVAITDIMDIVHSNQRGPLLSETMWRNRLHRGNQRLVSAEAERDMKLMVTILSVEHYLLMIFGVLQANPALLMPWLMMEAVVIALEAIFFGMRLFVEGLAINRSEVIMSAIVIHNWFQVFCFFRKYISLCDL